MNWQGCYLLLLEGLSKAFPQRIIAPPIPFVNSISDLLAMNLVTPSTAVRATARKAFHTMSDYYDNHSSASRNAHPQPKQAAGIGQGAFEK